MKKLVSAIHLIISKTSFKTWPIMIGLLLFTNFLFSQNARRIGVECGLILIPEISSSGTNGSNYSLGINSTFSLTDHWAFTTGVKFLKYGSHTYYRPVVGVRQIYGEALVEKQTYDIKNIALQLDLTYRTKYLNWYVSLQPEKALFDKQKVMHKVLPYEDINFEHYPQKSLNEYNFTVTSGFSIEQNFGEKISFLLKPGLQYFVFPIYKNEGFEAVKFAFHLTLGINYNLNESSSATQY